MSRPSAAGSSAGAMDEAARLLLAEEHRIVGGACLAHHHHRCRGYKNTDRSVHPSLYLSRCGSCRKRFAYA